MKMNTKGKGFFQWFLIFIIGLSTQLFLFSYEKEIKTISQELAQKIEGAGKKSVAIVDFNDLQGNVLELGRFLSEELSVAISSSGKGFEVVDRVHLKALLKEYKLSFTGLINKESAQKLGQIAGVDALITGTITPFGDSVRITVKILDINTAKLIGAVTANIPKTKAIEELSERGIGDGFQMDTGGTITSTPTSSGKIIEVDGFIFKPGVCRRKGSDIVCTFSIMNNGNEDREIRIYSYTERSGLVDNFGNKYAIALKIGSRETGLGCCDLKEKFPPKLFVMVSIIANDVKPEATHYTAIISIEGFKNLVTIRNIPVVK
jgi:TolB-like protein